MVDTDDYFCQVVRYVERNALRQSGQTSSTMAMGKSLDSRVWRSCLYGLVRNNGPVPVRFHPPNSYVFGR